MEEILKFVVDNGLGVASFIFMVIYILTDKKAASEEKKDNQEFMRSMVKSLDDNTQTLKIVNDNQREMTNTLEKLNYKIENLENKIREK